MIQNRREFLTGVGAAAAGELISKNDSMVHAPATNPRSIDVHTHFGSPLYVQTLIEKSAKPPVPGFTTWYALDTFKSYSPARCIEDMDRGGVEVSVVSNAAVGVWFGDLAETRRLARDA